MCEFVSWKKYKEEVYFLTDADLATKAGKRLLAPEVKADITGHGAIEAYYPELKGKGQNLECTDFSTPANFPPQIVDAIKKGKLSQIGICLDILNAAGIAKYEKIQQSASAEYLKIQQSAFWKIAVQAKYRIDAWK